MGLGWWKGVNGELGWDVVGFILLKMSHWDGPCTERREEQHQESACLHLRLSSALKFRCQEGPNHGKTQHKEMTPGALSAQVKMSFKNLNFCLSVLDNPSKTLWACCKPPPSLCHHKGNKTVWLRLEGAVRRCNNPLDSSLLLQALSHRSAGTATDPGLMHPLFPVTQSQNSQWLDHWVDKRSIKKSLALTPPVSQPSWLKLLLLCHI